MNSTSTDTLGGRIGSELKRSGISMRELARRIDIAQPSISKWCSNQAVPRVIYLERMAKVFGVSAHWLTYGEHASGRDEVVIRPRPESSETIGLSLTADSAKRTFGTEANKLSLFTQESDDMAPTIRSGSLVVINHTINKAKRRNFAASSRSLTARSTSASTIPSALRTKSPPTTRSSFSARCSPRFP